MPKIIPAGLYTEKDIQFSRAIEACMKRSGKKVRDIAAKGIISERTHYNRLRAPGDMTVNELRRYIKVADIPEADVLNALYPGRKKGGEREQ